MRPSERAAPRAGGAFVPVSVPPVPRGRPLPMASGHAFDEHHPPAAAQIGDCVHCGFCLPACPTYVLWGEEMDSPRGRILLMDLALRQERPLTAETVSHWDACLGCLACVGACPSGVAYDQLLEGTRQQVERRFQRPLADRLTRSAIFALFPHPGRLRVAAALLGAARLTGLPQRLQQGPVAARLPKALRAAARIAPRGRWLDVVRGLPRPRGPAGGAAPRLRVALLAGCVQRVFFSDVNEATAVALAAYGAEVWVPPGQGCCGALELHAGREAAAQARARALIRHLEDPALDRIAVNAAGCGAMLRTLDRLFADDPAWAPRAAAVAAKVRDVTEILMELGPPPGALHPLPMRVAYHDACHLAHAQGVREAPRRVLGAIPGLEVVEVPEGDLCCGSAGIYNLTAVTAAEDLGRRKAANIRAVSPVALVAGNPGCLLQIDAALRAAGAPVPSFHPVELVAASLRGVPVGRLLSGGAEPAPCMERGSPGDVTRL